MKKFLVASLLVFLAATVASASVLFTALPSGKGNWSVDVSGSQTSNFQQQSNATANWLGASVSYGLTDSLDLYVGYKALSTSSYVYYPAPTLVPTYNVPITGTGMQFGGILKYTVLNEIKGAPVSLALGLGTSMVGTEFKATVPANGVAPGIPPIDVSSDMKANGNTSGLGIIVSKLFIPFVPYAAVQYLKNGGDIGESNEIDATIGTAFAFSRNWAILLEYNAQSTTPTSGGSSVSNNQIAAEISWSK